MCSIFPCRQYCVNTCGASWLLQNNTWSRTSDHGPTATPPRPRGRDNQVLNNGSDLDTSCCALKYFTIYGHHVKIINHEHSLCISTCCLNKVKPYYQSDNSSVRHKPRGSQLESSCPTTCHFLAIQTDSENITLGTTGDTFGENVGTNSSVVSDYTW